MANYLNQTFTDIIQAFTLKTALYWLKDVMKISYFMFLVWGFLHQSPQILVGMLSISIRNF